MHGAAGVLCKIAHLASHDIDLHLPAVEGHREGCVLAPQLARGGREGEGRAGRLVGEEPTRIEGRAAGVGDRQVGVGVEQEARAVVEGEAREAGGLDRDVAALGDARGRSRDPVAGMHGPAHRHEGRHRGVHRPHAATGRGEGEAGEERAGPARRPKHTVAQDRRACGGARRRRRRAMDGMEGTGHGWSSL